MMKACAETTRPLGIKTMVSLNPIMVDGTGMCGGCRVKIGDRMKFACVDGPDFDGHEVDFDDLMNRLRRFKEDENLAIERWSEDCRQKALAVDTGRRQLNTAAFRRGLTMAKKKTIRSIPQDRAPMAVQEPERRVKNFDEVALGFTQEDALVECDRCLLCPEPACVAGCPVGIDIPGFIIKLSEKDYRGAYDILSEANLLPAICGRVCPQEDQCEGVCPVGDTLEPVAIGRLERWVGDQAIKEGWSTRPHIERKKFKVGIVGSGPAGMACAADLAKAGCEVIVYEAFHEPGGVLRYGIPEFRLPNDVVDAEIANLKALGVQIECNTLVGRLFTIEQMRDEMGFDAVFIGTGAGAPRFMDIPGETLNGVLSANELLTRCNLMMAGKFPELRHAASPGPPGRHHRLRQYGHGCDAGLAAHGRRESLLRLPQDRGRESRAQGRASPCPGRGHRVPLAHGADRNPRRRRRQCARDAMRSHEAGRSRRLGSPQPGCHRGQRV